MLEYFSEILSKIADFFPCLIGSIVSLKFLPDTIGTFQRLIAILCSFSIGTYFGRGLAAYLNIGNPRILDAIVFGSALFGLAFVGQVFAEMKPLLEAIRNKLTK